MSLFGAALAACSSNDEMDNTINNGAGEGTATVSLNISYAGVTSRAASGQIDATAAEKAIKSVKVIAKSAAGAITIPELKETAETGKYQFTINPGNYTLYAVVNNDAAVTGLTTLDNGIVASGIYTNFYKDNNFLMGSVGGNGVTIQAVADNYVTAEIEVERAAVKVTAGLADDYILKDAKHNVGTTATKENNSLVGTILTPQLGLKQIASKTYAMAFTNNAYPSDTKFSNSVDTYVNVYESDTDVKNRTGAYALENVKTTYTATDRTFAVYKVTFIPAKTVKVTKTGESSTLELKETTETSGKSFCVIGQATDANLVGEYIFVEDIADAQAIDSKLTVLQTMDDNNTLVNDVHTDGICYLKSQVQPEDKLYRNSWYNLNIKTLTIPGSSKEPEWEDKNANAVVEVTALDWYDGGSYDVNAQ